MAVFAILFFAANLALLVIFACFRVFEIQSRIHQMETSISEILELVKKIHAAQERREWQEKRGRVSKESPAYITYLRRQDEN